ncbi:metal-dependent hydrolase [Hyphomicrobium sp. D-2]|uniref:metal-dependent hydrolase n=1 Tax=Hyphomicrobium sp. D-2 TaxID=3041621 RepID=UPI0024539C03|nr:metal-dependent hydrolase [Hyphomicrobium sp. D-2]MDH4982250.1 metal-dependent hydrolase [Hyphomicrobium sp. D-2]
MANFPTHIVVGTLVAGSLATLTLAADVIAPENLVAVTLAGSLGSVLPDIDLKDSRPSRALFSGLAVFFAFVLLFQFAPKLSIAEMWLLWLGTLLFVRYGLHTAFHRLATHRGLWHSLVAGLACAFFTMIVFYYVFDRHEGVAWLAGGFLFIGYLTHLVLDEIYSVDVLGNRIKRSFGTAFKLFDRRNLTGSALMGATALGLLFLTPPIATFYDGITSRSMWDSLHARLLPQEMWFGSVLNQNRLARAAQPATPLATGSLPAAPAENAPTPAAEQDQPAPEAAP